MPASRSVFSWDPGFVLSVRHPPWQRQRWTTIGRRVVTLLWSLMGWLDAVQVDELPCSARYEYAVVSLRLYIRTE